MRRAAAGFTLIELIAVLVIVGLLAVFVPLALDYVVASRSLEKEVTKLGNTIELLHEQAILDRAPYAIHYDTEKNRWATQLPRQVEAQDTSDSEGNGSGQPATAYVLDDNVSPDDLDWHQLPDGITIKLYEGTRPQSGRYRILFYPSGYVPCHTVVFTSNLVSSLDEKDRCRTLTVHFPGYVSYSDGVRIEDYKISGGELGR